MGTVELLFKGFTPPPSPPILGSKGSNVYCIIIWIFVNRWPVLPKVVFLNKYWYFYNLYIIQSKKDRKLYLIKEKFFIQVYILIQCLYRTETVIKLNCNPPPHWIDNPVPLIVNFSFIGKMYRYQIYNTTASQERIERGN